MPVWIIVVENDTVGKTRLVSRSEVIIEVIWQQNEFWENSVEAEIKEMGNQEFKELRPRRQLTEESGRCKSLNTWFQIPSTKIKAEPGAMYLELQGEGRRRDKTLALTD